MKYLLLVSLLAYTTMSSAQMFFDVGAKGSWGPTAMFNKNIFDDSSYDHKVNFGYAFGGKLGVHFNSQHAVIAEYNWATSKQDFEFNNGGSREANKYSWQHHDIMLLYRYSNSGVFVELGPKYSIISDVTQQFVTEDELDATQYFADSYTSGVFGFGSYIAGSDLLTFQIGIRLSWAFTDLISEEGKQANYPTIVTTYETYKKTNEVSGQLTFEVNYAFGRLAKESCAGRKRLIMFGR